MTDTIHTTGLFERELSRRQLLKGGGALVIGLSLGSSAAAGAANTKKGAYQPGLGPYGPDVAQLDTWLAVKADNTVTLYTGIVPLGTGSLTGVLQIAAEELDVPFASMRVVTPDTNRTPDQFVSSGSRAISQHGTPIRQAAAEARAALVNLAATKLGVPVANLKVVDGVVSSTDGKSVKYGELLGGQLFNAKITGTAKPKDPSTYKIVGTAVPRIDFAGKVAGKYPYVQNLKLPGMLHGRVVRPPTQGAKLLKVNGFKQKVTGVVKIVQQNDWLGVVAKTEWEAVVAARMLDAKWSDWSGLPKMADLEKTIRATPVYDPAAHPTDVRIPGQLPASPIVQNVGNIDNGLAGAAKKLTVSYATPYHAHGSIGPSCGVATWQGSNLTVWSPTQTPYGTREAIAKFFGLGNDKVRLISMEGSGCYGQNGSDDATLDAAIFSKAVGKPVRVQWMRSDELAWENYKSARVFDMSGGVDATGRMVAWKSESWGFTGYGRPEFHEPGQGGEPGSLLAAQLAGWTGNAVEEGYGGGQGSVAYAVPNAWAKFNYLGPVSQRQGPIRIKTGSMRTVNGLDNTFASESFVDELAALAGVDPLDFRIKHLTDPRAVAALRAAADRHGYQYRPGPNPKPQQNGLLSGRGVAYSSRVGSIVDVTVNPKSGRVHVTRATVAVDAGQHVNPKLIEAQVEGAMVQGISRTTIEEVQFDETKVTSRDWTSYPILRFKDMPNEINVVLLPHQDQPSSGVGEAPQNGVQAVVANAIFDATGVRIRQTPFTPARVLAALKAAGKA
jgi:nicotinate dehydrogenase subunit B